MANSWVSFVLQKLDHKLNRFRLQPRRDPPALLPHLSLPIKRRRRRRKTLSKSITYELNSDVSLTRGIIYEDEEGENVPNEARRRFPNPTTTSKSWKMRQRASASLLPRVKTEAQEDDDRTADVVECEDVLRSLIKTSAPPSSGDGYCEETGVFGSGVHFLTTENLLSFIQSTNEDTEHTTSCSHHFEDSPFPSFNSTSDSAAFASNAFEEDVLTRKDLLEYLMNSDGSCVCKLCGEVLASRTHWYRHKYKVHTPAHISQTTNTSITPMENKLQDLHYCRECKQFFKSKKGYLGHLLARHSNEQDCSFSTHAQDTTHSSGVEKKTLSSGEENKLETTRSGDSFMVSILDEKDYNKQREMEEKMVKDIIAKVKRECEEQGEGEVMMMRKGYTKKMRK